MAQKALNDEVLNRLRTLQIEVEQLQVNLSAIEQQTTLVGQAIDSFSNANKTLTEFKTKNPGDEILVPIGGSNYIICTVKELNKTFISIGSGISLLTNRNGSQSRNESQINGLEKNIKQLQEQYSKFSQMLNIRRQEIAKIAREHEIAI